VFEHTRLFERNQSATSLFEFFFFLVFCSCRQRNGHSFSCFPLTIARTPGFFFYRDGIGFFSQSIRFPPFSYAGFFFAFAAPSFSMAPQQPLAQRFPQETSATLVFFPFLVRLAAGSGYVLPRCTPPGPPPPDQRKCTVGGGFPPCCETPDLPRSPLCFLPIRWKCIRCGNGHGRTDHLFFFPQTPHPLTSY